MNSRKEEQRKSLRITLIISLIIIVIVAAILYGKQAWQYIDDSMISSNVISVKSTNQRFKAALKRHKNDDVVVRLEKECLWKKTGQSADLVLDLELEDSENPEQSFYPPTMVVSDTSGNIYVMRNSQTDCCILKFDENGNFLQTIGGQGSGPGEFLPDAQFDISDDQFIYVGDYGNQRLSKFTLDGELLYSYKFSKEIKRSSYMKVINDKIYFSFYDSDTKTAIHLYNPEGEHLQSFGEPLIDANIELTRHLLWLQENYTNGSMVLYNDQVIFSRSNPYELSFYDQNANLTTHIFRKSDFLTLAKIHKYKNNTFYPKPPFCTLMDCFQEYIFTCMAINADLTTSEIVQLSQAGRNYESFMKKIAKKYLFRSIVDIFDSNGSLLYSMEIPEYICFQSLDAKGRLYGCKVSLEGTMTIVRYSIHLDI